MCSSVVGVADETFGAFPLRGITADRSSVGHHVLHLGAGTMTSLHRQKRHFWQREAHLIRVQCRHRGGTDLLQ